MIDKENNFAYIDGANLYKGIQELGWKLNYRRFRIWLQEKGVLRSLVSPSNKCSFLLRKLNIPLVYLDTQKNVLEHKL